jgi:hypothetical protein
MPIARRTIAVSFVLVSVVLGVVVARAATVHHDQHFVGIVNGNHTGAVVTTVCPGPVRPGQTGHPTGNQYVAVILFGSGKGFTGYSGTSIEARFNDDTSAVVRLAQYGVGRKIPTTLNLPCSGKGTVSFVPVPSSDASADDTVQVTYENIAV